MQEAEQNRYREELLALRGRLTDEARKALDEVADKVQSPDELSSVPTHAADRDSEGLERDVALEANREQMLEAIDRALERIEAGEYGRCEDCGGEISTTRLEVLPFALRCVDCEGKREEG